MAYGCAGSSPAFRTILKGSNNAKLLLPFLFSDPVTILVLSDALDLAFWTACNSGFGSIIFHCVISLFGR